MEVKSELFYTIILTDREMYFLSGMLDDYIDKSVSDGNKGVLAKEIKAAVEAENKRRWCNIK